MNNDARIVTIISMVLVLVILALVVVLVLPNNETPAPPITPEVIPPQPVVNPASLDGFHAELTGAASTIHAGNTNVIFDNVLYDANENIQYNTDTGEITILDPGNYYISWYANVDGTAEPDFVRFTLNLNDERHSDGILPVVSGTVSGSAFMQINDTPGVVSLVNTTSDVLFGATDVQANIVILEIN